MSELDDQLGRMIKDGQNVEAMNQWFARYGAHGHNPRHLHGHTLSPMTSPHQDLVEEFTARALAAGLGVQCLAVHGPDGLIYVMKDYDPRKVLIHQRFLSPRKPKLGERRAIKSAHENLVRDGKPIVELEVTYGFRDDAERCSATWYVYGRKFYEGSKNYGWGSRETFAKACAAALLKKR